MDDWGNVTAPPYLLASRGARFVAALLNGVVAAVPLIVGWALDPSKLHAAANGSVGTYTGANAHARFSGVTVIGWLLVLLVNGILLARRGQSIGKLALGIEIVQTDGSRASLLAARPPALAARRGDHRRVRVLLGDRRAVHRARRSALPPRPDRGHRRRGARAARRLAGRDDADATAGGGRPARDPLLELLGRTTPRTPCTAATAGIGSMPSRSARARMRRRRRTLGRITRRSSGDRRRPAAAGGDVARRVARPRRRSRCSPRSC